MRLLLTLCFSVLTTALIWGGETVHNVFEFNSGQKLDINLKPGGSIEIEAWDRQEVALVYEIVGNDRDNGIVETEETAEGLRIVGKLKFKALRSSVNIDVKLKVPRLTDIHLYTSGGSVTIRDIEGYIDGKTMGGVIRLEGLVGEVHLTTMGGNVFVESSELDGKVKTMGGNIQFTDVLGNIDGKTMGGNVTYNNVSFKRDSKDGSYTPEDVVNISTMGGEIRVEDAPFGAKVKTMGGEIKVGKAAQFVQATTMGGDITIDEIDGWVKATTMGGDVSVRMIGDPNQGRRDVEISSMGGEINLEVPAGLSMSFDIELEFTKNSSQDFDIISDFSVERETSKNWSYLKGSPRKTIRGTGEVDGGKHRIKIHTINGNVNIRKAR